MHISRLEELHVVCEVGRVGGVEMLFRSFQKRMNRRRMGRNSNGDGEYKPDDHCCVSELSCGCH